MIVGNQGIGRTNVASSQSHQQQPKPNSFALKTEEARSREISEQTHYTTLGFQPSTALWLKTQLLPMTERFQIYSRT
jgi:hypothetical protein